MVAWFKQRRLMSRSILFGVPPLLIVSAVFYLYATGGRHVTTENAYVKADVVTVSTNVDGQVAQVFVRDNQVVEAGEPLFALDPRPFGIAVEAARAELAAASTRVASLGAQYDQKQMEIAAAQERIRYFELAHERQQNLLDEGVGTRARFDETEHELALSRRGLSVAEQANSMVIAELGGDPEAPIEDHPLYLKAKAELARAELNLEYATVLATKPGVLSRVTLEPGEHVEAGDALFALVVSGETWIEANYKEIQLTHVRVGQSALITIDSFPDRVWRATIESISPATGAEFAILPPQNATGNWVKVVQRIPVRLTFDEGLDIDLLRAGMTATVSIDTEHERDAAALFRDVFAEGPGE